MNAESEMNTSDGLGGDPSRDAQRIDLLRRVKDAEHIEGTFELELIDALSLDPEATEAEIRDVAQAAHDEEEAMNAGREMATTDGLGGDQEHGDGFCPKCGSANICAQTASDAQAPWGCLDCDAQFEDPEKPMFAVVVVVEAEDPEKAWETVSGPLKDDEQTRYVGAPWESIPPGTIEFTTAAIQLGMTIPAKGEQMRDRGVHALVTRGLTPCN